MLGMIFLNKFVVVVKERIGVQRETGARDCTHLPLRCCFLYKAPQIRSCTHPPDCAANFEFVCSSTAWSCSCASPSSSQGAREGVARGNGRRTDRLRLTFIRSSWSTLREQQPSVTRSRCHRLSASERPSSITSAVRVRKGETPRARWDSLSTSTPPRRQQLLYTLRNKWTVLFPCGCSGTIKVTFFVLLLRISPLN